MSGIVRIRPWEIAINHVRDGCESMSKRIEELECDLNEAYEVIENVVLQFETIKKHQHSLLHKGFDKAVENWDAATNVSIDFSKAIEWLKKGKDKL